MKNKHTIQIFANGISKRSHNRRLTLVSTNFSDDVTGFHIILEKIEHDTQPQHPPCVTELVHHKRTTVINLTPEIIVELNNLMIQYLAEMSKDQIKEVITKSELKRQTIRLEIVLDNQKNDK